MPKEKYSSVYGSAARLGALSRPKKDVETSDALGTLYNDGDNTQFVWFDELPNPSLFCWESYKQLTKGVPVRHANTRVQVLLPVGQS